MKLRLFDAHCDTAYELWRRGEVLYDNTCHIDLKKASAFSAYAQIFAFCSYAGQLEQAGFHTCREALTLPLETLKRELRANADRIGLARSAEELERLHADGKVAALLSVEGAELIDCNPERLPGLREEGFCMSTLTWNADNALAGCRGSERGLSEQGRSYVHAAQALRLLIDLSHLGDRAFWELVSCTHAPILASHSNCRALCGSVRNLTDDQMTAIAETGGVVGLNLYAPFLGGKADLDRVLAHLERMLRLCGERHVCFGGDLDGCDSLADGFTDLRSYCVLYDHLSAHGYSEKLLDRLFFDNLLQLLKREVL